ncbi:O-antigen ligase family protein [Arenibacter sp. F26102]|uniref:O-antigen ligase family protein n=1 Tax=Arenibacter sp. F26102 TaxID=2926416 RepID=UPI001FF58086|nr:O-antigen ligase family protein [Arenibacter sp. F26102]MCK0144098.1 O-antigen ligase family protein [Arenibacter sp. F26102]
MKIQKLTLILLLITVSSFTYFIDKTIVKDIFPFDFAQAVNIIYVLLIFLISFFGLLQKPKIVRFLPLNVFLILITWVFFIGLFFNSPIEILPSFLRFYMYFLLALLTYNFIKNNGLGVFDKKMKIFTLSLFLIACGFGFYEAFFMEITFMNGAYRYSGSFLKHPLADSMFLAMVILLWFEYFVMPKKSFLNVFGLLLLFYLFINTHSRMPLVFLFFSFFLYYFLKEKRVIKFFKVIAGITVVLISLYFLITKTEISPRLRTMVLSEKSFKDPSTNTRFTIIENTISNMDTFENIFGIGLGGFNNFYEGVSGKSGVAAHNNFLLFYTEGGIIGLIIFLFYQLVLVLVLFQFIRKPPMIGSKINYRRLIFVSVFLMEICSFLLNNYYFFTSQAIVFILVGLLIYMESNSGESSNIVID